MSMITEEDREAYERMNGRQRMDWLLNHYLFLNPASGMSITAVNDTPFKITRFRYPEYHPVVKVLGPMHYYEDFPSCLEIV